MAQNIQAGKTFKAQVLEPRDEERYYKVFETSPNGEKIRFAINPTVLFCGSRALGYASIYDPRNSAVDHFGYSRPIQDGLRINVTPQDEALVQENIRGGGPPDQNNLRVDTPSFETHALRFTPTIPPEVNVSLLDFESHNARLVIQDTDTHSVAGLVP